MIDFNNIEIGDKVKVVGMGAPGFAELGDKLVITKVEPNRVYARHAGIQNEDTDEVFFALTCGAARLEKIND